MLCLQCLSCLEALLPAAHRMTGLAPQQVRDACMHVGQRPLGRGATGDTAGAEKGGPKAKSWRDEPVEKRLAHALVKGIDEFAVRVRRRHPSSSNGACDGAAFAQAFRLVPAKVPSSLHQLSKACRTRRRRGPAGGTRSRCA